MDFLPSEAAERFRAEVRELLADVFTDAVREEVHETGTIHSWPLHRAIGERGWIAQALPEAQGGGGRDPEELAALFAELERAGAPYDGLSNVVMVSSVLAHVGNDMIRAEVLPRLLSGEAMVCLGYTEPDSGSDVAAARTRAVHEGDGWRIDGQKMFTSVAEEADWIFLLTRTSGEGPKHAGLTFFLVPMDTPGISLQAVRTLPGKRVNVTFLDGVRVGDEWRVGAVDGGWQVMLVALSFERGLAGGVRDAERLLRVTEEFARRVPPEGGGPPIRDPVVRERLVRLAIDTEVADLLAGRAAWVAASGRLPGTEGAAARLFASESFTRAASWAIDLAGAEGLVQSPERGGRIDGFFEHCYRLAPGTTLAGGTSEIQRNLIAQRGLGLPRT
ncbi:MAG TPA: acyl-CoA dehydrogenase family protein [Acidimicrobiia bacterium]|nr:acyl-CoA dehydrogenase family protein [Acidimicrobiia bacterium]